MLSPLNQIALERYRMHLELESMSKTKLIDLCIQQRLALEEIENKRIQSNINIGGGKADNHTNNIRVKVFEVFVDLTNKNLPTWREMEYELNKRFPEHKWVYEIKGSRAKDEQGFYRALLHVRKYLSLVNKQQESK